MKVILLLAAAIGSLLFVKNSINIIKTEKSEYEFGCKKSSK